MISDKEIRASNALLNDATTPQIAVFVGGTSGIGKLTIRALVSTGASTRIYLVGRKSSEEQTREFIEELRVINPRAEIVWVEGEVSLLADTKRVCESIKAREGRVDLLFLSAGYAPFRREETSEGVEVVQSLEYYSRMLFILHLLPLLTKAEGRVVSVLAGGLEVPSLVDLEDIDLKKPGNFSARKTRTQYPAMNTSTLDKLAGDNPGVTFIHSSPGWVATGNARRGLSEQSSWFLVWFVGWVLEPLIGWFSIKDEVSGQRHLFQSTSAVYGGRGVKREGGRGVNTRGETEGGLFLVGFRCGWSENAKVMKALREKAQEKIWEHTQEVLGPYL